MSQVFGSKFGIGDEVIDACEDTVEGAAQGCRARPLRRHDLGRAGSQDPCVGAREEQCGSDAWLGETVAVRLGYPLGQAVESKSAQFVGHATCGEAGGGQPEQGRQTLTQFAVGKASDLQSEAEYRRHESLHPGLTVTQACGALVVDHDRLGDLAQGHFTQRAVLRDLLDVQETSVGAEANLPQQRQILEALAHAKVTRVIDRGFDSGIIQICVEISSQMNLI